MPDWASIFDAHRYPEPPASEEALVAFRRDVLAPVNATERAELVAEHWRIFRTELVEGSSADPAAWELPDGELPESFLSFLRWSDGGEFETGDRRFQFFGSPRDTVNNLRGMMLSYRVPQRMPGFVPFAFNGGCVFYLFDMRDEPRDGEYPIVAADAGNLDPEDCWPVADGFEAACRGTVDIEHLAP